MGNGQLQSFSTYFKVLNVSCTTHDQSGSLVLKSAFSELYSAVGKEGSAASNFVELNTTGVCGSPGKLRITLLCMEEAINRDKFILEQGMQDSSSRAVRHPAE